MAKVESVILRLDRCTDDNGDVDFAFSFHPSGLVILGAWPELTVRDGPIRDNEWALRLGRPINLVADVEVPSS